MTTDELLKVLVAANTAEEAIAAVERFAEANTSTSWTPVGGRRNNCGPIEASANPARALVERVTNAVDAVLDFEFVKHAGKPACQSPREAATAWLNVPEDGLSAMEAKDRRRIAQRVTVKLREGTALNRRIVEVIDQGIGLTAEEMPRTILSLNESNKVEKLHLAGTYGQGGSATFVASQLSLIASRKVGSDEVAFTVVKFEPPPLLKGGSYVYLVLGGKVLTANSDLVKPGTACIHYGYDLKHFPSPLGPNSLYGHLQEVLFDPVLPIWFDNRVRDYRRVIKGSRNALNGAKDEGDDTESKIVHSMPMFYAPLGEYGRAGIEYWVLDRPEKAGTKPSASFVNPIHPIILTLNGQNQGAMPVRVIRKDAELPYLATRLICHIDCNSLSLAGKKNLFASSRETVRHGTVYDLLERELVNALKSDEKLEALNAQARDQRHEDDDKEATQAMRKEVARLLKLQGFEVATEAGSTKTAGGGGGRGGGGGGGGGRGRADPIEVHEPPTFIRIVWPANEPIELHPSQQKYIRIETDAHSRYHDPKHPEKSSINVAVTGDGFQPTGSTPLKDGRMRVLVSCTEQSKTGTKGRISIELRVPGMKTIADERELLIVEPPKAKDAAQKIVMPDFDVRPVDGPDDPLWASLGWPESVATIASEAVEESGKLVVYYSRAFPHFVGYREKFEAQDVQLSKTFESRYKVWLAVHSLILKKAKEEGDHLPESETVTIDDDMQDLIERGERCRMAVVAAMVAAQDAKRGEPTADE
ncbi:MAG: hypothetical protein HRU70_12920 [Phycisphaeraceae bacterium]|nr:MAG: hypothetical protein HRU70_12920 [Phycisphaeraceae bacterium]